MYGYHKPSYAAQEMLGTYASGQTVGNPLQIRERSFSARRNTAVDPVTAGIQAGGQLLGAVFGSLSQSSQSKKAREHEAAQAQYNLEAQGLAAKTAELQAQAAAAIAGVDAKKAATYAAYGMGTVVLLGAMALTGFLVIKKRRG